MTCKLLGSLGVVLAAICFLLVGSVWAQQQKTTQPQKTTQAQKAEKEAKDAEEEAKIAMKDLPAAVQAAVRKETQGSEIVGISKESDNGKTVYEVETKVKGRTRDMLIDATGALTEVEEEISIDSLPAAVQAEVKKSIGKAKLVKLESVYNGAKVLTGYSATVENAGKQSEIEMGADGKVLPPEKK